MPDSSSRGVTRRDFNIAAAAGVTLGLTVGRALAEEKKAEEAKAAETKPAEAAPAGKLPMRDLGKTGLKVSEISLGAMRVKEAGIIRKSIEEGVNYVDTAASYQNGQNEVLVGEALKGGLRDKVILATKWSEDTKEGLLASLDKSLQKLQTDHVEFIQWHGADNAAAVKNGFLKEAFDEAKKAGKARFFGITTHSNQVEVINACIETGYVDQMLIGYNKGIEECGEAVKRAREAGIATVIMKPVQKAGQIWTAGSGMTSFQMAIRWLLDQSYVDTVNVGMNSFAQLEEDLKASSLKMTAFGRMQMDRFAAACAGAMCARCGACLKACANGIKPAEFVRAHMYAADYGDPAMARAEFVALGGPKMLAACGDCGACERACIRGLDIRNRMREVASLV